MPNQWAQSQRVQYQPDGLQKTTNAKPMGTISLGSMSTRHKHTKLSMPNQWARSQRVQCQPDVAHKTINVKSKDTILVSRSLRRGTNYSYHCNQSGLFCN